MKEILFSILVTLIIVFLIIPIGLAIGFKDKRWFKLYYCLMRKDK